MFKLLAISFICLLLSGCTSFDPRLDQKLNNQDGHIDDIKNNQNGIMLDMLRLKNQQEITARDVGNLQQGNFNRSNQNSGVQILQGDGGLILIFALGTIGMLLVYHYRSKFVEADKTANILADQIALYDDIDLDNAVFMAAMNADVERDVYHKMVNAQTRTNTMHGLRVKKK